ncbi:hypothetical protein GCM10029963_24290 [Micromonospora andamanensis]|uniref:FomB family phosphonate monophosphate kinase n=1 Tax=Micromonospora andamanensis TaxID=1287068 RepID=UPI00195070FE|nr:FomB family phosphonate monophosphate kinase [Micromonospora andamanensis]GIJ38323.1 hypothetical protein Vwe01_16480 [Micromonospora andamanensis]
MSIDLRRLPLRTTRTVDLNRLTVRISTNLEDFSAYAYFSRYAAPDIVPDYEITCIDLDRDPADPVELAARSDRTLRAKRFRAGYYLSHVFGEPAYLMTEGNHAYVFGRRLERTVWPYFVKQILTNHALDHGYLHLKAGGIVLDGEATLLVGCNGGGKTVFLTQACHGGARFLTNTHTLVRDGVAYAVPSGIRVREDPSSAALIASGQLVPHLEGGGEYVATPEQLFGAEPVDSAPVRNVVIVNYDRDGRQGFERIAERTAETFLDQFAFAVTMYGLKDDVFAHAGGDVEAFADQVHRMRQMLTRLVRSARCYRANVDMIDPEVRRLVLKELAE